MSRSAEIFNLVDNDGEDYLDFGTKLAPAKPTPIVSIKSKKREHVPYKPAKELFDAYNNDGEEAIVEDRKGSKKIPLKSVQEHQLLMNQLNAYGSSVIFAPVLKQCDIKIKDLRNKTLSELKELKERVQACCANSAGSGGIVKATTLGMCGRLEAWAPKRLLDLDGYQAQLESNPEFAALCEMIEIDSGFKLAMTPMQRMVMCLGTTAMSVSASNKIKEIGQNASQSLLANLRAQQQQQSQAAAAANAFSAATAASAIVPTLSPIPAAPKVVMENGEEVRVY
jgi:hypothetical protein